MPHRLVVRAHQLLPFHLRSLRPLRGLTSSGTVLILLAALAPAVSGTAAPAEGAAATMAGDPAADRTARTRVRTRAVPAAEPSARTQGTGAEAQVVAALTRTRTRPYGVAGVTWRGVPDGEGLTVELRSREGATWSAWEELEIESAHGAGERTARAGTSAAWVGDADGVAVRVLSTGPRPRDVEVALIDGHVGGDTDPARETGGHDSAAGGSVRTASYAASPTASGVTPQPAVVTRGEWGVDTRGESACTKPTTAPTMKGIVLHHSAGSNDYTPEEAPGIVRAIHAYHTQTRGWCDVGYNFLVDRYGVIYEGRRGGIEEQVRGAHSGNWDVNTATSGVSMIGNFETEPVPTDLRQAVVELMAWRLSSFGHGAFGQIWFDGHKIPRISGHRDVHLAGIEPSTATACPGAAAYDDWLNRGLRKRVRSYIEANAEPVVPATRRMAGQNRYATAADISRQSFGEATDTVFLASGEAFPDALSAGPSAAGQSAPVLLVADDRLPYETAQELQRLQPSTVYLLGGPGAVAPSVAEEVRAYAGQVVRLSGSDRYATGVAVTGRFWSAAGTVYLASGGDYPDALSGGALAARDGDPILLSHSERLPDVVGEELARLGPARVVVLGGTSAVSPAVVGQVEERLPGVSVDRLSGADRFETSADVGQAGWDASERIYLAVGTDFPDALAGVPAAAVHGAPLLLARRECLPAAVFAEVTRLDPQQSVLLGGASVLEEGAPDRQCASA